MMRILSTADKERWSLEQLVENVVDLEEKERARKGPERRNTRSSLTGVEAQGDHRRPGPSFGLPSLARDQDTKELSLAGRFAQPKLGGGRCSVMPRFARRVAPHAVHHVISRFVNRAHLFDLEGAREEYLTRVAAVVGRTDWRPLAFALMSSHVHWVMEAGEQPSWAFVKPLHAGFAAWLNRRHRRLGPVFAERHRTIVCAESAVAVLLAYVHNNPVRAGLVSDPAASTWTSHRAFAGLQRAPPWLDEERGLLLAGFMSTPAGRRAFHDFVVERSGDVRCSIVSESGLGQLRAHERAQLQAPVEIGSPFATVCETQRVSVAPTILPAGCVVPPALITAHFVIGKVAGSLRLALSDVQSRRRTRSVVMARRLSLLVWVRHLHRPAGQMASALGIAASTASLLLVRASREVQELAGQIAQALAFSEGTGP